MFKKILTTLYIIFCLVGVVYLALPNYSFPKALPGSLKSQEPADLESPLRQGYFTNYTRAEVLAWYGAQFNHAKIFGFDIKLPTPLLNYPPEYAQTLIRDQTSSTFLQEYVHPFRESMYINGFEPKTSNNEPAFTVGGQTWKLKVIVRFVPSNIWIREIVFILSALALAVLYNAFEKTLIKKHE